MINENQKKILKKTIKNIIHEMIEENGYFEAKQTQDDTEGRNDSQTRADVKKWVRSAIQKDSTLAYQLWPEKDKYTARSLFAKKAQGEDSNGNSYDFTEPEIVKLDNIKDDYMSEIQ